MAAGTISVTNASSAVTGQGTSFTADVSVSDYLLISTGGITYLLGVISIQSDTALTLSINFDGPTASGLAYNVIPQSQLIQVPAQLINQTSRALREMQQNEDNWNQLLTEDGDVTITNPDGTTTTGPSWPAVAKGIDAADLEKAQAIADQTSASADAAATSETNAKASEDAAAQSATDSASSASDSATSAQQSADSASSIGDAVTQAAQSASDASASADRAEAAAEALENNNALAEAVDHIDDDNHDVFFKGGIASGAEDASTQIKTVNDGAGTITTGIIQTDSSGDDPVTKTWTMPDDEGQLITLDDTGILSVVDSGVTFKGSVSVSAEAAKDSDLVTLRQLNSAVAGSGNNGPTLNGVMNNQIGSVFWFNGSRASLWTGTIPADGQVVSRAAFPDLWEAVNSGLFLSTDETTWQTAESTGYTNRAKYSTGGDAGTSPDTSVTDAWFRVPDLNGSQDGSLPNAYLRGSNTSNTNQGRIHPSGAPSITGGFVVKVPDGHAGKVRGSFQGSNGTQITPNTDTAIYSGIQGTGNNQDTENFGYHFDASLSSSLYGNSQSEIRPTSAIGIWVIRASGVFDATNTNFNVINSDSSFPDPGVNAFGGDVRSVYQVAGQDYLAVAMRGRVLSGTGIFAEIRMINTTDSVSTTTWTLPNAEGTLFGSGQPLSFDSASNAHQSLQNMGVNSDGTLVILPFSPTQGFMIISRTVVQTQNTSGDSTITFPRAFTAISNVVCSNGDGGVGNLNMNIINSIRPSGFDVRCYNNGTAQVGNVRVNYIAAGVVNI